MSTIQAQLLLEVERFLKGSGLSDTAFGKRAVNDGKFVPRLRSGANMTLATIERVQAFMRVAMQDAA